MAQSYCDNRGDEEVGGSRENDGAFAARHDKLCATDRFPTNTSKTDKVSGIAQSSRSLAQINRADEQG